MIYSFVIGFCSYIVSSQTLTADHIHLQNANGIIKGQFDVKNSISIHSESGVIDADISLHPRGTRNNYGANMDLYSATGYVSLYADPVFTSLRFSYSNLTAVVNFGSNSCKRSEFSVAARTETGSLGIEFIESQRNNILHLNVSAHQGVAAVFLPPYFQGQYLVHSEASLKVLNRHITGNTLEELRRDFQAPLSRVLKRSRLSETMYGNEEHEGFTERLHHRKPVTNLPSGTLDEGWLYWKPWDPKTSTSVAWIQGREVFMVT
jgi:hypothetical protein